MDEHDHSRLGGMFIVRGMIAGLDDAVTVDMAVTATSSVDRLEYMTRT